MTHRKVSRLKNNLCGHRASRALENVSDLSKTRKCVVHLHQLTKVRPELSPYVNYILYIIMCTRKHPSYSFFKIFWISKRNLSQTEKSGENNWTKLEPKYYRFSNEYLKYNYIPKILVIFRFEVTKYSEIIIIINSKLLVSEIFI